MLKVIGAGLPRTGTRTLKQALPQLVGGPCYHMSTVFDRPEETAVWQAALDGNPPDWHEFFADYAAAVDWPASAFWEDLAGAFPDALILLSRRSDGQAWWRSADATIMEGLRRTDDRDDWWTMSAGLWRRTLCQGWEDPVANAAACDRWVEHVRGTAPSGRLLEWQASDGWAPLCAALGVPTPDEPFPHTNSTAEWERRRRQPALEQEQELGSA